MASIAEIREKVVSQKIGTLIVYCRSGQHWVRLGSENDVSVNPNGHYVDFRCVEHQTTIASVLRE
jgi:hypothetical protein